MFLAETTWLALSIWVSDHGLLLGAVALTSLQRLPARRPGSVRA